MSAAPQPDLSYLTLTSANPPLSVTALRGDDGPSLAGGFGGWQATQRPRKKSLTVWGGIEPLSMSVPLLFDGFADDVSVEHDCNTLEQMAQPPAGGGEPPVVRLSGAAPHTDIDWVIRDDLEWDSSPLYSSVNGYRVRQAVVVHLLEYVADDRLAWSNAADKTRKKAAAVAAAATRTAGVTSSSSPVGAAFHTVRRGETLQTIANERLGSYKRWPELAAANDLRDPNRLTAGQRIRIP